MRFTVYIDAYRLELKFDKMHSADDTVVLQFGRVGPNQFNMDYQYPLSPLQGNQ